MCSFTDTIRLQSNQLRGKIPSEIATLTFLSEYLEGLASLPPWSSQPVSHLPDIKLTSLVHIPSLDDFYLHSNKLTGTIPSEIASMDNLSESDSAILLMTHPHKSSCSLESHIDELLVYDNLLTGNFTCPNNITVCDVSCFTNFTLQPDPACRVL